MSEPHDDDVEEQGAPRGRALAFRLLRGFVVLNLLFALVSVGIALYLKLTRTSVGEARTSLGLSVWRVIFCPLTHVPFELPRSSIRNRSP